MIIMEPHTFLKGQIVKYLGKPGNKIPTGALAKVTGCYFSGGSEAEEFVDVDWLENKSYKPSLGFYTYRFIPIDLVGDPVI